MALEPDLGPEMRDMRGRDPQEESPDPPGGGMGRNLPLAIAVGLGLGALVIVSLFTVKEIFLAVMFGFLGVALWELAQALTHRRIRLLVVPIAVGGLAMALLAYIFGPAALLGAFALTVLGVLLWRMPAGPRGYVRDVAAGVFGAAYIPLMGGFAALLLAPDDGAQRITIFIAVTVSSDIAGYFAGVFLGRHKMVPAISPKKTWEGFAGSALGCMLIAAWLMTWLLDAALWEGALLGLLVACSATLGDLVASLIKRDMGIKDMGTLLPGHGGVLDRLDSLILTVPVVWVALQVFAPPG